MLSHFRLGQYPLSVDKMSNQLKEIIKMKKMTKVLTTALVIALAALTLVGCAKKDTSPVTTDGSTSMEKVIGTLGEAFKEKKAFYVTYNPTGPLRHSGRLRRPLRIGLSSRANDDKGHSDRDRRRPRRASP